MIIKYTAYIWLAWRIPNHKHLFVLIISLVKKQQQPNIKLSKVLKRGHYIKYWNFWSLILIKHITNNKIVRQTPIIAGGLAKATQVGVIVKNIYLMGSWTQSTQTCNTENNITAKNNENCTKSGSIKRQFCEKMFVRTIKDKYACFLKN